MTKEDAAQVSVPAFAKINTILTNQLEAGFRQSKPTADTPRDITSEVDEAVA